MPHAFVLVGDLAFTYADSHPVHELFIQQMDVHESVQGREVTYLPYYEVCFLSVYLVLFEAKIV